MNRKKRQVKKILSGFFQANLFFIYLLDSNSFAQVASDGRLPVPTEVRNNGNLITISGGTKRGKNLFHSLNQFSIQLGNEAYFDNPLSVNRIISRVTGTSVSKIDGLIRANGVVDLFLLNPNGLILGPSASLNIGGSFIGTTAENIGFLDGNTFSSLSSSNGVEELSSNIPYSLYFRNSNSNISVNGAGHNIPSSSSPILSLPRNSQPSLQVSPSQTLSLIANNLSLNGGLLSADSGFINLAAVKSGKVILKPINNGWDFQYDSSRGFGNISLFNNALLDASGDGSGRVSIRGKNIDLSNGALVVIQHRGEGIRNSVNIHASELLSLENNSDELTGVIVENLGNKKSGNVSIKAVDFIVSDATSISASTFSSGGSADIDIEVSKNILFSGGQTSQGGVGTFTNGSGDAGNIVVRTNNLKLVDGGIIASQANIFADGASGDISVFASENIEIFGTTDIGLLSSTISTSTQGSNDAGNITLVARRLSLRENGRIAASTFNEGSAGNIIITVTDSIDIDGQAQLNDIAPTQISASAEAIPPSLRTAILMVFGIDFPEIPSGNSGNISLNTSSLRISNNAQVSVQNQGTGTAGNLLIKANDVFLDSGGQLSAVTNSGQGGNIVADIDNYILMRGNSQISTSAGISGSPGSGGNINLSADFIVAEPNSNSDITANSFAGEGGEINITARQNFFGFEARTLADLQQLSPNNPDPSVLPSNDITAISQTGGPELSGQITINTPNVDPGDNLPEQSESVEPVQEIRRGCRSGQPLAGSSFTHVGRGGLPLGPYEAQTPSTVWQDLRAYNLQPTPVSTTESSPKSLIPTPPSSIIEAQGWTKDSQGRIHLTANVPQPTSSPQPIPTC